MITVTTIIFENNIYNYL